MAQDENPVNKQVQKTAAFDPFAPTIGEPNDDNPFGSSIRSHQDPFASSNDSSKSQRIERDEIRALKKDFQQRMATVNRENSQLKEKINYCEARDKFISESYGQLLENMLDSEDAKIQLLVLEKLQNSNKEKFRPALTEASCERMVQLTESQTPEVKNLAIQWLIENNPAQATALGYQRSGTWYAVNVSPEYLEIRRALNERSDFEFEEIELQEIIDELQSQYRVHIKPVRGVDLTTLVTYESSGLKLGNTLKGMLSKYELEIQVFDEKIAIVPEGHPESKTSLIYHVKGLVVGNLEIEKIKGLIEEVISEQELEGKVSVIDNHRLTVTAAESVQAKVSEFLGQLTTN
jgi:hypothetical protein